MGLQTRRAGVCPNCGQPVSVFAAGCAYCGADLESHRRNVRRRPALPHVLPRVDAHVALVAFTVLAVLLSPLLGLLLAVIGAQDRHRNGQINQRNMFLVLAVTDGAMFLVPSLRFGILSLIYG